MSLEIEAQYVEAAASECLPADYISAVLTSFHGDQESTEKWLSRQLWTELCTQTLFVFGSGRFDGGVTWTRRFKDALEDDEPWPDCARGAAADLEVGFLREKFVWHAVSHAIEFGCERIQERCLFKSLLEYKQRHREVLPPLDHVLRLRFDEPFTDLSVVKYEYDQNSEGRRYLVTFDQYKRGKART